MANIKQIKPYQFKALHVDILTPEAARYADQVQGRDIMREYMSLRKVAQERLRKLKIAGLTDIDAYTENVNRFPSKREIGSDSRLLYDAIADVTQFLSIKKSRVGGYHEIIESAETKFEKHYGAEGLQGLDWRTFGKMMEAIKTHANASAYYRGWKRAYRSALSAAKKRGMTAEQLNKAVSEGAMRIGPRGGLYPVRLQR